MFVKHFFRVQVIIISYTCISFYVLAFRVSDVVSFGVEVITMFKYRDGVDVLARLSAAGWTSYRMRHERIMGEKAIQKIRDGDLPSWRELDKLCRLLRCHPSDLIEYRPDD